MKPPKIRMSRPKPTPVEPELRSRRTRKRSVLPLFFGGAGILVVAGAALVITLAPTTPPAGAQEVVGCTLDVRTVRSPAAEGHQLAVYWDTSGSMDDGELKKDLDAAERALGTDLATRSGVEVTHFKVGADLAPLDDISRIRYRDNRSAIQLAARDMAQKIATGDLVAAALVSDLDLELTAAQQTGKDPTCGELKATVTDRHAAEFTARCLEDGLGDLDRAANPDLSLALYEGKSREAGPAGERSVAVLVLARSMASATTIHDVLTGEGAPFQPVVDLRPSAWPSPTVGSCTWDEGALQHQPTSDPRPGTPCAVRCSNKTRDPVMRCEVGGLVSSATTWRIDGAAPLPGVNGAEIVDVDPGLNLRVDCTNPQPFDDTARARLTLSQAVGAPSPGTSSTRFVQKVAERLPEIYDKVSPQADFDLGFGLQRGE